MKVHGVLHLNGDDLTALPLEERKSGLPSVAAGSGILVSQVAERLRQQLDEVERAIADVDYRAANGGHTIGMSYIQDGVGQLVVVDGIAMSVQGCESCR